MDKVNEETLLAAGFKPKEIFLCQIIAKDNLMGLHECLPKIAHQFKILSRTLFFIMVFILLISGKESLNTSVASILTLYPLIFIIFPVRLGYRAWLL